MLGKLYCWRVERDSIQGPSHYKSKTLTLQKATVAGALINAATVRVDSIEPRLQIGDETSG